jgi:hypothetical protein
MWRMTWRTLLTWHYVTGRQTSGDDSVLFSHKKAEAAGPSPLLPRLFARTVPLHRYTLAASSSLAWPLVSPPADAGTVGTGVRHRDTSML